MHEELEARLRAAREELGGPSFAIGARVLAGLRLTRPPRGQRLLALLRCRPLSAVGATAAVGGLVAVIGVLFVNSSSSVRPGTGRPTPVPNVVGRTLELAYQEVRDAGFTVTIPRWFTYGSGCPPFVGSQSPPAESEAPAGSAVTIEPGGCLLESLPGVSDEFRLDDFRGHTVADLAAWAQARSLSWRADDLPPVAAATRPGLFDNFTVARQQPAPGTAVRSAVRKGNGVLPTPIVVQPEIGTGVPRLVPAGLRLVSLRRGAPRTDLSILSGRRALPVAQIRGPVTVMVLTNHRCVGCPAAPVPWQRQLGVETLLISLDGIVPPRATRWLPFPGLQARLSVDNARGRALLPRSGIPETILLDREGRIALRLPGPVDTALVDGFVAQLVKEPVPPITGPVTPLPLARVSGPALPQDRVPAFMTPLSGQACPVDPRRVYVLGSAPDGSGRIYLGRAHGDGVVVQTQWGRSTVGSSNGCGNPSAASLARALRTAGVVGADEQIRGTPGTVLRVAFVVADGYRTATVAGKTYRIDGNGFLLRGAFPRGTTVVFRGPAGVQRRKL